MKPLIVTTLAQPHLNSHPGVKVLAIKLLVTQCDNHITLLLMTELFFQRVTRNDPQPAYNHGSAQGTPHPVTRLTLRAHTKRTACKEGGRPAIGKKITAGSGTTSNER